MVVLLMHGKKVHDTNSMQAAAEKWAFSWKTLMPPRKSSSITQG
jgi:hypothetical protein